VVRATPPLTVDATAVDGFVRAFGGSLADLAEAGAEAAG
jgi:hypothetical protein